MKKTLCSLNDLAKDLITMIEAIAVANADNQNPGDSWRYVLICPAVTIEKEYPHVKCQNIPKSFLDQTAKEAYSMSLSVWNMYSLKTAW
jgi:hypothetical protein